MAGHHQRLLVGQGDALSALEGSERRIETCGTDHRVEHDVDVISLGSLHEARRARMPARVLWRAVAHDANERRTECVRLLLKESGVVERGEGGHAKAIALAIEDA